MKSLVDAIERIDSVHVFGRVQSVQGLLVEISGPVGHLSVGGLVRVETRQDTLLACEIVGFKGDIALCLPFGPLEGVSMGCKAHFFSAQNDVRPSEQWLGRVMNGLGMPIDAKGALVEGNEPYSLRGKALPAHVRVRVGAPLDLGIRALNTFTTLCEGQRMGIFSGSGVGKSGLMSLLAEQADCDVAVIGLIGERGREVQEFIQDNLGEVGLARSVLIVATSDEPALLRRQAAYLTMTVAEYFRDQGNRVLCMMDSLTRFAMAQREIGLSVGEPPTSKGYTPTVFTELPKLLERAGPGMVQKNGQKSGSVTGLFTVLVEGDDHNEPIADAVRGILDGHIVMERAIAERGRYPAINILRSVSRTMPRCVPEQVRPVLQEARDFMSIYADMEELIRLGAYRSGADAKVDRSIELQPEFERFLTQGRGEFTSLSQGYADLAHILALPEVPKGGEDEG